MVDLYMVYRLRTVSTTDVSEWVEVALHAAKVCERSVQFSSVRTFVVRRSNNPDSRECNAVKWRIDARRSNGTATFSVSVGIIVRVSGLRHGTIEVVSSSLFAATLQNCVVRRLTFWFAGQPGRLQLPSVSAFWQVRLSEVRRQVVPDSRSSCTEGSVAEVGARPTDEKSVSRAHSLYVYTVHR